MFARCCCAKSDANPQDTFAHDRGKSYQDGTGEEGDGYYEEWDEYGEGDYYEEWWDEDHPDEEYGGEDYAEDGGHDGGQHEDLAHDNVAQDDAAQDKEAPAPADEHDKVAQAPAEEPESEAPLADHKEEPGDASEAAREAAKQELPAIDEEAADEQRTPPQRLEVTLKKPTPSSACGWQLDSMDPEVLFVSTLAVDLACPVQVYNASVAEEVRIRPGDYLVEVNGAKGAKAMAYVMKSNSVLNIIIKRPQIFELSIAKTGKPLGLGMKFSPQGTCLLVEDIGIGAVKEAGHDVRAGDRITAVCGATGPQQKLLSRLKASDPVILRISRHNMP